MRARSSATAYGVLALVFLAFAAGIVAITVAASPLSVLRDVAAVTRMPVPGSHQALLAARGYGLYFGMLNAPARRAMKVPKLSITIVPPDGIADPEFVQIQATTDVLVDGFHTVQVARIQARSAGTYQVHVESPEESGGSFSIGELPMLLPADRAVLRAAPGILLFAGLSAAMAIGWAVSRRRQSPGPPGSAGPPGSPGAALPEPAPPQSWPS